MEIYTTNKAMNNPKCTNGCPVANRNAMSSATWCFLAMSHATLSQSQIAAGATWQPSVTITCTCRCSQRSVPCKLYTWCSVCSVDTQKIDRTCNFMSGWPHNAEEQQHKLYYLLRVRPQWGKAACLIHVDAICNASCAILEHPVS